VRSCTSDRYELVIARPARRALAAELPLKAALAAWELINGTLRDNPRRVGKPLHEPFAGQWVARRSSYRVRYRIDEDRRAVIVLDVRGRADAYR
jgi:mRNA interferase RelE/StbE